MPKAAFCADCGAYVWVSRDGGCVFGHLKSQLRDHHDTEGPLPPLPGSSTPLLAPAKSIEPPPPPPTKVGEITTKHVDVLPRRAGAFATDWVIGQSLTYYAGRALATLLSGGAGGDLPFALLLVAAPVSLSVLYGYFFAFEATVGVTPGKALFGLRIVDSDGRRLSRVQALKRNVARIVDLILFGGVGLYLVSASPLRQRLGDRWGKTFVVRA
ncbi:MAG: RDD family protein [Coriobacteriia bacterium]|nr:RDD family protein [Coriobacteriia bacterium]